MTPYVVCVGSATRDTIFAVPRMPGADDRVVASEVAVAGGGPAATAAVTLARLGVPVYLVAAVGDDEAGAFIRAGLVDEGVDVSELRTVEGAGSPQSAILVGPGGRAIVHHPGSAPPLELGREALDLCRGAAWVHVDHAGYDAASAIRDVTRLSVDGGNPIPDLDLHGVSLYAPTERALREAFGTPELALGAGAALVVFTRGAEGSIGYTAGGDVIEAAGRAVDAVSTLGAGDVFHGALLAQLVREAPLADALAFANECAARSCRALDARSAIPSAEEVAA